MPDNKLTSHLNQNSLLTSAIHSWKSYLAKHHQSLPLGCAPALFDAVRVSFQEVLIGFQGAMVYFYRLKPGCIRVP